MLTAQEHSLDLAFDKGLQLAFPPVMVQLLQALIEPEPSFAAIARYLKMDSMLSAKVLHVVNTTSYAFTQKIVDLERAAIAIGTAELFKLVISLSLQKRLNPATARESELLFADWRTTLWAAIAAENMAKRLCPEQRPQAYLAGMLKDISLFLAFCREEVPPFLQGRLLTAPPDTAQVAEENAFWGSTHQELAHAIFLYWGLPLDLAESVRKHHDAQEAEKASPLERCVIYGTRWAELLHIPDSDPGKLVSFELTLAPALGLDGPGMEKFREKCAEKFEILLGQLGISRASPETRLYDRSLSSIQSYYFLALQAVSEVSPGRTRPLADALRNQLRLFWGYNDWELFLLQPNEATGIYHVCSGGVLKETGPFSAENAPRRADRLMLPIAVHGRDYGFLSVPAPSGSVDQSALPMFVHMLGVCLDEHRRENAAAGALLGGLTLAVARLDKNGRVEESSPGFLNMFGLGKNPDGMSIRTLAEEKFGLHADAFEAAFNKPENTQGGIAPLPGDNFPATPVYFLRSQTPDGNGAHVFFGEVGGLTPLQSLALMHSEVFSLIFEHIHEQICVLDMAGIVVLAGPSSQALLGKNIFALSSPLGLPRNLWRPDFLKEIREGAEVKASVIVSGSLEPHSLIFLPLSDRARRVLLILRPVEDQSGKNIAGRQRDALTGLYGYSQFHTLLKQHADLAGKKPAPLGVLFCDIASLHRINELYGVEMGDTVLRRVAEALIAACRPGQDFPCRYGLDKFAAIIPGATQEIMESAAAKVHSQVAKSAEGKVRVSIGLALAGPGQDPAKTLDKAKNACLQAADMDERTFWAV